MKGVKCVLLCGLALLLVSCNANGLRREYQVNSRPQGPVSRATAPAEPLELSEEVPYDELITKEIDIHEIAEKYFMETSPGIYGLYDIEESFGVECLRRTTDTLYSVHKVRQGGLLYTFYADGEYDKKLHSTVQWFYVVKNLSYADFQPAIEEKATIEQVRKIDPATQIHMNLYEADREYWDEVEKHFITRHYLTDGILELAYEKMDGEWKIFDSVYMEDYVFPGMASHKVLHDAKILPIDRLA